MTLKKVIKTGLLIGLPLVLGTLIAGCSVRSEQHAPGSIQNRASKETLRPRLGKIASTNEEAGFVLVDIGTAPAPEAGAQLEAFGENGRTSDLSVSTFQRRPFLIADIRQGRPRVGDSVVLAAPASAKGKSAALPAAGKGVGRDGTVFIQGDVVAPEVVEEPVSGGIIPGLPLKAK